MGIAPETDSLDCVTSFEKRPMAKNPYIEKAKELKRLGVISYDLRGKLSSAQKGNITRQYEKYGGFIENPQLFHAPHVKSKSAKQLKSSGYLVTPKGRAIIPLKGNAVARISQSGEIRFEKPGEKTRTLLKRGTENFMERLKKAMKKKLASNQMVTVKIGNNSPFNKARFSSYAELFYYMDNLFDPHDDDIANLWPFMQIVEITDYKPKRQKKQTKKNYEKGTPTRIRRKRK
jgi:hypothetical protein